MKITLSNPEVKCHGSRRTFCRQRCASCGRRGLLTGDITVWQQSSTTKTRHRRAGTHDLPARRQVAVLGRGCGCGSRYRAGDDTYRIYLTAPALYGAPRWTNHALATAGAEPYPVTTRPLGVPNPDAAPTLTVGVDTTATTFSVDITDNGDQLAPSGPISPVVPFCTN